MEDERRQSARLVKSFTVQYGYVQKENNQKIWDTTTIKDISDIGASFYTAKYFVAGESIMLRIKIPTNPFAWTELNAEVLESSQPAFSMHKTRVKFVDLKDEQKKLITECVAQFLGRKGGRDGV